MPGRDVELDLIGHDHTGHATRSAANNLDQLRRRLGKFNASNIADLKRDRKLFARSGIDAARAFTQGFIRTVSLGMLGRRGLGGSASGAAKVFGPAGVAAGLVFGAKLLASAGDVILAGLPLILGGAIAAGPIAHLVISEKERVKALKERIKNARKELGQAGLSESEQFRLKTLQAQSKLTKSEQTRLKQLQDKLKSGKGDQAKLKGIISESQGRLASSWLTKLKTKWDSFTRAVSKPIKAPFLATVKEIGRGLDHLKKPFASLVSAIGPALKPFTKGVFDGIVAFVKALKPAMPGITAGLKAWGTQLPVIGKAFGDMLAKLLKDPKRVTQAIENTSKLVQDIITLAGDLTAAFLAISDAFAWFDSSALGLERATRSIISFFSAMAIGVVSAIDSILTAWATINPLMKGPAAAVHRMLLGMQAGFQATKNKWAETDAEFKKRKIVAQITATIDDLQTKIAAAKAKLKTVHNAKARAKIEATIKDLEAKVATAKARLAVVRGAKTKPRIQAEIKELEAKVAAAKAKLKTVHNAKTQAKIRADISQLQSALAAAKAALAGLHGKTITITTRTVRTGGNPKSVPLAVKAAGVGWEGAAGGSYRTGGPRITLGDTNVDTRVFIDGAQIRATARSTVIDENRRQAHRARVGRR